MKRRQFLAISAVSVLATGVNAGDELHVEYSDEVYEQALSSGKPFILDFFATW